MSTELVEQTNQIDKDAPDMVHLICCIETIALCGKRIKGVYAESEPIDCIVCVDLRDEACPICGL